MTLTTKQILEGVAALVLFLGVISSGTLANAQLDTTLASGNMTSCGLPGTNSFVGCYYEGEQFERLQFKRDDGAQLDFDWGIGSPHSLLGDNNFSVEWRGIFDFDDALYEFTAVADDGFRLFVGGEEVIGEWRNQSATTYTVQKRMDSGLHSVTAYFYEDRGEAVAKLSWEKVEEDSEDVNRDVGYYPHASPSLWYIFPGQNLGFSGSDFVPNEMVHIREKNGDLLRTVTVGGGGNFSISNAVTVPFSWQNSLRSFMVRGDESDKSVPITIVVGTFYPQISPSTYWISSGEMMSVSGRNFAPNEAVSLEINNRAIAEKNADGDGDVSFSFRTPTNGSRFELTLRGMSSEQASTRTIYTH